MRSVLRELERRTMWAKEALPYFARQLRMQPDDYNSHLFFGGLLSWAGKPEDAKAAMAPLVDKRDLDVFARYNLACLYEELLDYPNALAMLRRAVEDGYAHRSHVEGWRTNNWIVGHPEDQPPK